MDYDVIMEEVNKNWMKASMNWSYLENTFNSTKEAMDTYWKEVNKRNPKEKLSAQERQYMDFLLVKKPDDKGNMTHPNLRKYFAKLTDIGKPWEFEAEFMRGLRKAGLNYNPQNELTVADQKVFVSYIQDMLKLGPKFKRMVDKTNKNKQNLAKEMKKRGFHTRSGEAIALQYYAH